MTKTLLTVLGALSLVACGGTGVPYGGDDEVGGQSPWPSPGTGGSASSVAGTSHGGSDEAGYAAGGYATAGTGYAGGLGGGGYSAAGTGYGGGNEGGASDGGYGSGGTGNGGGNEGGTGYRGYDSGGTGYGGSSMAGTGSSEGCARNVAQCFEAAANCYEYSPSSDCDQIVDICATMQAACEE